VPLCAPARPSRHKPLPDSRSGAEPAPRRHPSNGLRRRLNSLVMRRPGVETRVPIWQPDAMHGPPTQENFRDPCPSPVTLTRTSCGRVWTRGRHPKIRRLDCDKRARSAFGEHGSRWVQVFPPRTAGIEDAYYHGEGQPRSRARAAAVMSTEQSNCLSGSSASLERDPSIQQCIEARYLRLSRPSLT
jgi:hypothetical protein